ncbi:acyltransferase [Streptomyces sp. NPDC002054]|uniref:acyltransferase family protein n=1 Tax=Streptomyces sp. NPDC002054 TaxID=3154663 RepID=UPI003322E135
MPVMQSRLPSLTGLRFIAALMVFALHVTYQNTYISGSAGKTLQDVFARSGFYGVSFFFVLSGFVLTWSARADDRATSTWRRRLVKIYPNHLATMALAAVLMLFAADVFTAKGIVANLFLVQSWTPDLEISRSMNQVSWSLSCELFFYLSFPLLFRVINRVPVRRLWAVGGVLVALILAVPAVSEAAIGGVALPYFADGSLSYEQMWFVYLFPPVRALEFVLGMVVARLVMAGAWPRIGLLPAFLIAAAGYAVNLQLPYLFGVAGVAAIWLMPLIAAAASADVKGSASPFRGRVMTWLGDISFAFYMVHGLVVAYFYRWVIAEYQPAPIVGAAAVLGVFAVSLALSHAMFVWLEQPLMRRFSTPRAARQATAPAAAASRPLASVKSGD